MMKSKQTYVLELPEDNIDIEDIKIVSFTGENVIDHFDIEIKNGIAYLQLNVDDLTSEQISDIQNGSVLCKKKKHKVFS